LDGGKRMGEGVLIYLQPRHDQKGVQLWHQLSIMNAASALKLQKSMILSTFHIEEPLQLPASASTLFSHFLSFFQRPLKAPQQLELRTSHSMHSIPASTSYHLEDCQRSPRWDCTIHRGKRHKAPNSHPAACSNPPNQD